MENEVNLLLESIKFMILGMGVVYLFLGIMVVVVNVQAKIIAKYFPDVETPVDVPTASRVIESEDEAARVAAIIAAVTEFRKNK